MVGYQEGYVEADAKERSFVAQTSSITTSEIIPIMTDVDGAG